MQIVQYIAQFIWYWNMNLKEIGLEIKKRRKYLSITQEDLAEITGISRRSLQYIESGKMNPSVEQLEKILKALGLEIIIRTKLNAWTESNSIL